MKKLLIHQRKSILGPIISVFVMVLVVSILAGLTFLFVANLKTNVIETTLTPTTVTGEDEAWINSTGYTLAGASNLEATGFVITGALNSTDGGAIGSGNYTVSSTGVVTNASATNWANVTFNYTYSYIAEDTAYQSVNKTELAGATVVNYLSLIFLAVIFGAILTLVLRIITPYINLGQQMGDGF